MNSESKRSNWNFDPEDITEGMRQYPVIDIEYSMFWNGWNGEPRYLWHNWDDRNPVSWRDIIIHSLKDVGDPTPLGELLRTDSDIVWNFACLYVEEFHYARITEWEDYDFAPPGVEPSVYGCDIPVDWSGFLEEYLRALAAEVDDDEERVEESMSDLLGQGVSVVDLIKALRDQ